MYAQLIFALGYCFHLFGRRRADLRVCAAAADVFGCAEGLCGAASAALRGESG